eukprot:TRINITY_DN3588_c0_g1_i1.p1 TRINITY_DN3588_c0_g1~~TRINITY_DN3588_c0_g1_i1.p1  ORF type:complete len:142 (-),score=30.46 TRINITY_DN3588_c0_g1_i1:184-609(-)
MDMNGPSLPLLSKPHDALRFGLPTFHEDAQAAHPVQSAIIQAHRHQAESKKMMIERVYGSALPLQMEIERQMLSRPQRLPGLPSSFTGLQSMTGKLDDFSFEDYLCDPRDSEALSRVAVHEVMERRLGMSAAPPSARPSLF